MLTPVHVIIITLLSMLPVHKPPKDTTEIRYTEGFDLPDPSADYQAWLDIYHLQASQQIYLLLMPLLVCNHLMLNQLMH